MGGICPPWPREAPAYERRVHGDLVCSGLTDQYGTVRAGFSTVPIWAAACWHLGRRTRAAPGVEIVGSDPVVDADLLAEPSPSRSRGRVASA